MLEHASSSEGTQVFMRLNMSLDAFRKIQHEFIRDLADILGCKASEIQIVSLQSSSPETPADFINAAQLQALGERGLSEY